MAFKRPALVADTTSTGGTGTYTLNDPASPGGGFRTLADAVADGHVSNGDTVYYWVKDTTTQGGSLAFEHGIGTVGSSGASLARTTILESSNSNNAVNWGSGGSRTVLVGVGVSGLALLAAANTFTSEQTFSALATFSMGLTTASGARFQNNFAGRMILDNGGVIRGQLWSTTTPTVRLDHVAADGSTVDSRIELGAGTINAATGTLQQGGVAVALQGVLSAPSGAVLMLGSTSVPAGWSLITTNVNDRAVILTDTLAQAGAVGGTWTITGSVAVDGHALSVSEMPSHQHAVGNSGFLDKIGAAGTFTVGAGTDWTTGFNTQVSGGGEAHSHTASATIGGGGTWRPLNRKFVAIQKL